MSEEKLIRLYERVDVLERTVKDLAERLEAAEKLIDQREEKAAGDDW